jgi:hypothetical protein
MHVALNSSAATSSFPISFAAVVWTESPPRPTYQNTISTALSGTVNSGISGTLKPALTLASSCKHVMVTPTSISVYNHGAVAVTVQLVLDATLTGASYVAVPNGRSITYDTSASAMSSGRPFMTVMVAPGASVTVPVKLRRPLCYPYPSAAFVDLGLTPSFVFETVTVGVTTADASAQGVIVSMDYDEYGASV